MNKNEEMIEMREDIDRHDNDIDYLIDELKQLKKRVYDIETGDV
jgi:uncharacterized coiled-coil protein SlyX